MSRRGRFPKKEGSYAVYPHPDGRGTLLVDRATHIPRRGWLEWIPVAFGTDEYTAVVEAYRAMFRTEDVNHEQENGITIELASDPWSRGGS